MVREAFKGLKNHQQAVVDFLSSKRPGLVLDAGGGTDALGAHLRKKGFRVVSLDLYETPVERGSFVRGDLNKPLPFSDGVFDYLLCSESLQYLENHTGLFREFSRVLKDGGSAVISIPNILSASSRLYFLQRGYYKSFKPVRTVDGGKGWDSIAYNPVSLVDIIELATRNSLSLKALKASRLKTSNLLLYPLLKALYMAGSTFEKESGKAGLIKALSSKEALLGDHLIIELERTKRQA